MNECCYFRLSFYALRVLFKWCKNFTLYCLTDCFLYTLPSLNLTYIWIWIQVYLGFPYVQECSSCLQVLRTAAQWWISLTHSLTNLPWFQPLPHAQLLYLMDLAQETNIIRNFSKTQGGDSLSEASCSLLQGTGGGCWGATKSNKESIRTWTSVCE